MSPLYTTTPPEESLDYLNFYQGNSLSSLDARGIAETQENFIKPALKDGFDQLKRFENDGLPSEPTARAIFTAIASFADELRDSDANKRGPGHFVAMATRFSSIYSMLQEQNDREFISDKQYLFFHFLLGLLRFDLAVRMGVYTAAGMFPEDESVSEFGFWTEEAEAESRIVKGLSQVSGIAQELPKVYARNGMFDQNPADFWLKVEAAVTADPVLNSAAKILASLHTVEVNGGLTTMAQVLHWNGFGGNAEFLRDIPELTELLPHAIAYHGSVDDDGHFKERMKLFGGILVPLKEKAAYTLAAYLNNFHHGDEVKVFDVGSGLNAKGVSGTGKYLSEGKRMKVVAADVTGSLLEAMVEKRDSGDPEIAENVDVDDVRYLDLTGDLGRVRGKDWRAYDVFSASLVLHQLRDRYEGEEELKKVMRFAAAVLKPGGVIHLPSVGDAAYLQYAVIPGNLVDFEGSLPRDLFARLEFVDVCSRSDMYGNVQVPYPLELLDNMVPSLVGGDGIYQYNMYVMLNVPMELVYEMDQLKREGDYAALSELVSRHVDINNIQERIGSQAFA